MADETEVLIWEYNGGDNQKWFWDCDLIRNKRFPNKVSNFNIYYFSLLGT